MVSRGRSYLLLYFFRSILYHIEVSGTRFIIDWLNYSYRGFISPWEKRKYFASFVRHTEAYSNVHFHRKLLKTTWIFIIYYNLWRTRQVHFAAFFSVKFCWLATLVWLSVFFSVSPSRFESRFSVSRYISAIADTMRDDVFQRLRIYIIWYNAKLVMFSSRHTYICLVINRVNV